MLVKVRIYLQAGQITLGTLRGRRVAPAAKSRQPSRAELSPIGLGTDLGISVRGPSAMTGIMALKQTHGRNLITGIWPREPRRFWHFGPMARIVRDLALGYSIMAGPDRQDAFSSLGANFDARVG